MATTTSHPADGRGDARDEAPEHGAPRRRSTTELDALQADDVDWKSGRAFSLAYHAGDDVLALATEAPTRDSSPPTRSTSPPSRACARMQADVVAMIADLLHGGPEAAGFMTSGGTESILLAVKAARTRGRARGIDGAGDGPADHRARGVREGRRLLRRALGARAGARRLPRRSDADGGGHHAQHGAAGRVGARLSAGRRRSGRGDRGAGGGARHQLPRRRLHGRHHAADARAPRPSRRRRSTSASPA